MVFNLLLQYAEYTVFKAILEALTRLGRMFPQNG